MTEQELGCLLAILRFPKIGSKRSQALRAYFGSFERAFHASRSEWIAAGISPSLAEGFFALRPDLHPDGELERLHRAGATAIPMDDDRYPALLKEIYDPPAVLFVRGTLPASALPHLAVVGSRKHTVYGRQAIERLLPRTAESCVIVSGLALGIDALAHEAALAAGAPTVAVLGSGIDNDNIYPSQNRHLASRILAGGGAILSEFPIGTHALKQNFPFRNRLIAGMCHGTLVVEAAEKSGTLITARLAMENGREVFSVPGPITSITSEGANRLLKEGATPAISSEDILEALGIHASSSAARSTFSPHSKEEQMLYDLLGASPQHVDDLLAASTLPAQAINATLSLLELRGGAKHVGGMYWVRA